MSRLIRSSRLDLDYGVLHRTGRKVPKIRNSRMAEFHIQAINICSDIEDLFDSHDIDELVGEDELHVYVEKLGEQNASIDEFTLN